MTYSELVTAIKHLSFAEQFKLLAETCQSLAASADSLSALPEGLQLADSMSAEDAAPMRATVEDGREQL